MGPLDDAIPKNHQIELTVKGHCWLGLAGGGGVVYKDVEVIIQWSRHYT
jgi:hypothetical protein